MRSAGIYVHDAVLGMKQMDKLLKIKETKIKELERIKKRMQVIDNIGWSVVGFILGMLFISVFKLFK